jgi:hypothetical protein
MGRDTLNERTVCHLRAATLPKEDPAHLREHR